MTEAELKLEIGTEAYSELSAEEVSHLLSLPSAKLAALRAFDLLRKKYKPAYRIGRTWEDQGAKYEFYDRLYREYLTLTGTGYRASETPKEFGA